MRLGLGARLTLAIVGVLVVFQALGIFTAVYLRGLDRPIWPAPLASRIAAAAVVLDDLPAKDREIVLAALNGDQTSFYISEDIPPGYRRLEGPAAGVYRGYKQALQERDLVILSPETPRDWRPMSPGDRVDYIFSVRLADGGRLNVAPGVSQRRRGFTLGFLALSVLMTLAAAVLTWRLVRLATAQLEAISLAADQFAADLSSPAMAVTGPAEAQRVSAAFNHMRCEIRRLMDERMRMLAAVAHDLKTLLTRLRLRVAMIEDEAQRARGDRDIEEMAALIEDVLLVARGEARPAVLTPIKVDSLVEDLVATRREAGDPVSLASVQPVFASADPILLRRVLENLIDNAMAYAGSAAVTVGSGSDGRAEIRVIDHGPGIPPAFRETAFEPFTRQEESRHRGTGGAGLGLTIARTLTRQMNGEVELEDTPDGGVTAVVRLDN